MVMIPPCEVALYIISFIPLTYYGYLSVRRYSLIFKNNSFLRRIFILSVQNYHILLFYSYIYGFPAYQIIIDILVFCISYGFVDCPVLITVHDCMGSHRSCLVIIKITMDSSVTRQSFHAFPKATDGVQYNIITWLLYANHIVASLSSACKISSTY